MCTQFPAGTFGWAGRSSVILQFPGCQECPNLRDSATVRVRTVLEPISVPDMSTDTSCFIYTTPLPSSEQSCRQPYWNRVRSYFVIAVSCHSAQALTAVCWTATSRMPDVSKLMHQSGGILAS